MNKKQAEAEEARQRLLSEPGALKPGTTVYTILRHVSRSGMFRVIQLVVIGAGGTPYQLGYNAALVLGSQYDRDREGVKVGGAGMDMGFHLVYNLSMVLFGDGYALSQRWL